jgi:hypothetical protein
MLVLLPLLNDHNLAWVDPFHSSVALFVISPGL